MGKRSEQILLHEDAEITYTSFNKNLPYIYMRILGL
jgi:hypothetical protein